MTTPKFTLPFVWPSVTDLTSQARDGVTIPFDHALEDVTGIFGIVSDVNDRGARWLEESLTQKPDLSALVILAVYAGCPTRSGDLARLLDLQAQATRKVEFRILPMTVGVGAPANCLVAVRKDSTTPVFLFGPTPNFTIDGVDRTQVNMAFRTESVLFDRWRRWFDGAWLQAAELTATTADIPALVPATGTSEATAQWDAYCAICAKSEQPAVAIAVDSKSEEVQSGKKPDGSEDPPPTSILNLPKLDSLAIRMTRLFATGKQVTIAHSSAIRPLDAPVNPRLLGQEAEHRDGAVVQRQSFRVSVFSEEELKKINEYRKGSQAIIQKLGLRMETGIYWLPDKALSILEDEINMRNEEAKNELRNLVEGSADDFVGRKIEKIKTDLENAYRRLGGTGDVPKRAVTEVADSLQLRIRRALDDSRLVTPVTFSGVRFTLPNNEGWQAPWAQAEKLVLALARFPRQAIHRPRTLSGLLTSRAKILEAMNAEDDEILRVEQRNRTQSERQARSELQVLEQIENADIGARDRCEAGFMLIDGKSPSAIRNFVGERESAQ